MRQFWRALESHRWSALGFLACCICAYAFQVLILHPLLPLLAGALVSGWRPRARLRGRLSAGLLAGAAVLLIDAAILIGPSAVRDPYGEGSPYVAFPMAIALFGSAGAVPGLLGALVRAGVNGLLHHADGSRSA